MVSCSRQHTANSKPGHAMSRYLSALERRHSCHTENPPWQAKPYGADHQLCLQVSRRRHDRPHLINNQLVRGGTTVAATNSSQSL